MFDIDHVIVKMISSIFNVNLFYFSYFISLVNYCFIIPRKFFVTIDVSISKIRTDPNADCYGYYGQDNTNCVRTGTHLHVQLKLYLSALLYQ